MTSELNISIWRSLAKQYGTPRAGTPDYEVKERVYRKAVQEAMHPPIEYMQAPPPVQQEYHYTAPVREVHHPCERCGHTTGDPIRKEKSMQMQRSEQYNRNDYPRGRPIYSDDSSGEEYNREMDRLIDQSFSKNRNGKMISGKVVSKKTEMRYAQSETDSDSELSSDSDCTFEMKEEPVKPKAEKKKEKKEIPVVPQKKKKEVPKVEPKKTESKKVVPKKIATTKKKKKSSD